jgi:phospholipase C
VGKTIHANPFTITDKSNTLVGINYINNSLVITKGQPSQQPATIAQSGNTFTITMNAGRSKSSSVADAYNKVCGGSKNEYAGYHGGGTPGRLNFYFAVQMKFQMAGSVAVATVYLGQGNINSKNNWWIGGSIVNSSGKTPTLQMHIGDQIVTLNLSGSVDTLTVTTGSTRAAFPIKNVFVLMLENHSFDNMLAMSGIPGIVAATTNNSNSFQGTTYPVRNGAPTSMPSDPGHEFPDVVEQLAGAGASYPKGGAYPPINNSGFASNYATSTSEGAAPPAADIGQIMAAFTTPTQLPVMYQLASTFTVCDHWYSSLPGPTWPNRFFVHGASSNGLDHSPSNWELFEWESFDGFGYPNGSIYDALKAAGVPYRLYIDSHNIFSDDPGNGSEFGRIPQVASLKGIFATEVHSVSNLSADLQGDYPYQYTFIEPNYGNVRGNYAGGSSQHPMDDVYGGEGLIKAVYQAIRNSPLWESSLLIVTYDEHGGYYDSVAPGAAAAPNDGSSSKLNKYGFTFEQYGVRVPGLVISPWVAAQVDHTVYDHSSVLATLEKLFGLQPLTDRDRAANDVTPLLLSSARTDCPTVLNSPAPPTAKVAQSKLAPEILDAQPLPDHGNFPGFLAILLKTQLEMSPPGMRESIIDKFKQIKSLGQAHAYAKQVMGLVDAVKAAAAP